MSPDEFIEAFQDRLLADGLAEPVVTVDLSPSRSAVSLDRIRVAPEKRRSRIAARVLLLLTQLCDESGMPIEVIPRRLEEGSMGDEDLVAWYERYGFHFAPTEDTPRLMRRAAQTAA